MDFLFLFLVTNHPLDRGKQSLRVITVPSLSMSVSFYHASSSIMFNPDIPSTDCSVSISKSGSASFRALRSEVRMAKVISNKLWQGPTNGGLGWEGLQGHSSRKLMSYSELHCELHLMYDEMF